MGNKVLKLLCLPRHHESNQDQQINLKKVMAIVPLNLLNIPGLWKMNPYDSCDTPTFPLKPLSSQKANYTHETSHNNVGPLPRHWLPIYAPKR